MNKSVLGIGSNTHDAVAKIESATRLLSAVGNILRMSEIYTVSSPYQNRVVEIETRLDAQALSLLAKDIERQLGRTPQMKEAGVVPIDIDVVIHNGEILRPRDYDAYYFSKGYNEIFPEERHRISMTRMTE